MPEPNTLVTRSRAVRRGVISIVFAGIAAVATTTGAQDPVDPPPRVVVIDRDGVAGEARLVRIEGDVVALAHGRETNTVSLGSIAAMVLPDAAPSRLKDAGVIELVDGRRFIGRPMSTDGSFTWINHWCGPIELEADRIRSFRRDRTTPVLGTVAADVVRLTNGDVVEGFLLELGDPVEIERDGSDEPLRIPLERVDAVRLVNPATVATGGRAWLSIGDVVDVGSVRYRHGAAFEIRNALGDRRDGSALREGQVVAIVPDASIMRPLSAARWRVEELGDAVRFRIPDPIVPDGAFPLDAAPIELSGPIRARVELAPGPKRISARLVLPERARRIGDVEVVVLDGTREVARERLRRGRVSAELAVEIVGTELVIELHEAGNGPVQDVVRLERAVVLDR